MNISFFQSQEDVEDFLDYIYAQGLFLSRQSGKTKGIPIDQQSAREAVTADLAMSHFGIYNIGNQEDNALLTLECCGYQSHPRYASRSGRCPGTLVLDDTYRGKLNAEVLFRAIRKYFKEKYAFRSIHNNQRFKCYWGPAYQQMDTKYAANPEPNSMCHGYVCVKCSPATLQKVYDEIQCVLETHHELKDVTIAQDRWSREFPLVDVYASFLFDRSVLNIEHIIKIARDIVGEQCTLCVIREKGYEKVASARNNKAKDDTFKNVCIRVEQEWKGFGVFSIPTTWYVQGKTEKK